MILYLDSSSAVKLYLYQARVIEEGAETVRHHVEEAEVVVTARITYAETRAGLARARRQMRISEEEQYRRIVQALNRDWPSYVVIALSNMVVRQAGDLAEKHGLRGYDAVQLASALELERRIGIKITFSSWDEALRRAAEADGLTITINGGGH